MLTMSRRGHIPPSRLWLARQRIAAFGRFGVAAESLLVAKVIENWEPAA